MVTKLHDGRGQVSLKGHSITNEWEQLVKTAAGRNGQTVADFVVDVTRDAAQAILKGEAAVPAALPARPEELVDRLAEAMARRADEQAAQLAEQMRRVQSDALSELRREARRGRWRR